MPGVLKPDLKAVVWLAIGWIVIPKVVTAVRSR